MFLRAILAAESRLISAATLLEAGLVIEGRQGEPAGREFDLFVVRAGLKIVPVEIEQVEIARSAWRRYGKGRHRAGLNFGDCFSYALSRWSGEALLAKGTDYASTDVVLWS